jgi:hypothetical protein
MKQRLAPSTRRAGLLRAGWLGALLPVVALGGCGAADDAVGAGGAVGYATYESSTPLGEGDGALLDGTLENQESCLVVRTPDGRLVVPVFPAAESTWDDGEQRLTVGETGYRVGDSVSLGGGYLDAAPTAGTLPEGCADSDEYFLVSST